MARSTIETLIDRIKGDAHKDKMLAKARLPLVFYRVLADVVDGELEAFSDFYPEQTKQQINDYIAQLDSMNDVDSQSGDEEYLSYMLRIVKHDSQLGLFIHGPSYTGKTVLASFAAFTAIAEAVVDRLVLFFNVPRLLEDMRPTGSDQNGDGLELARNAHLLVLDDLGAERMSQWVSERLYLILNHRVDANLPTIITTQYDYDDLRRQYVSLLDNEQGAERLINRLANFCIRVSVS